MNAFSKSFAFTDFIKVESAGALDASSDCLLLREHLFTLVAFMSWTYVFFVLFAGKMDEVSALTLVTRAFDHVDTNFAL